MRPSLIFLGLQELDNLSLADDTCLKDDQTTASQTIETLTVLDTSSGTISGIENDAFASESLS